LRDLIRAFNGMLARVDASLQGMRRFTADASHQMRTPLSILRTHIALLRQAPPGGAAARESIDDIDQASERLQRLLIQLLSLARADNAVLARDAFAATDANALAAGVAAEHAPDAVRAGIDLHFERASGTAVVTTEPMLAAELIGNLIDNAIRYNRPGGTVIVAVDHSADATAIVIEDDGPGIAEPDRAHVFKRFARLDRDIVQTGSGLGLPIAARLAEAIGARLTLETPASGRGLRAVVHFSLSRS